MCCFFTFCRLRNSQSEENTRMSFGHRKQRDIIPNLAERVFSWSGPISASHCSCSARKPSMMLSFFYLEPHCAQLAALHFVTYSPRQAAWQHIWHRPRGLDAASQGCRHREHAMFENSRVAHGSKHIRSSIWRRQASDKHSLA